MVYFIKDLFLSRALGFLVEEALNSHWLGCPLVEALQAFLQTVGPPGRRCTCYRKLQEVTGNQPEDTQGALLSSHLVIIIISIIIITIIMIYMIYYILITRYVRYILRRGAAPLW